MVVGCDKYKRVGRNYYWATGNYELMDVVSIKIADDFM